MSEFKCEVIQLPSLEPHPNADTLSVVHIFGYPVCVKTSDWIGQSKAVYLPVDSVVPMTEQFAFLGDREKDHRIKAKKLRGIFSMGLLIPSEDSWEIGQDVKDIINVKKYEEPEIITTYKGTSADQDKSPPGPQVICYDIENIRKYHDDFIVGEEVVATEKIHGANSRFTYRDDKLFVGSHRQWKIDVGGNASPWYRHGHISSIKEMLIYLNENGHKEAVLYGEIYGAVQDLRYGSTNGKIFFSAFDIYSPTLGHYLDFDMFIGFCEKFCIPQVPVVFRDGFDYNTILEIAEKDSVTDPAHGISEGLVIKPIKERFSPQIGGRLIAKIHSQRFLLRKGS